MAPLQQQLIVHGQLADLGPQPGDLLVAVIGRSALEGGLAGGQAALKSRPTDDRDDEIARLRAKVGELTMDNELLLQRCRADRPFVPTRRKR